MSAPASITESLDEQSDRVALSWNVPTSSLSNLWHAESNGSTTVENVGGDRGLVQINRDAHPEVSDAQAFDAEFALNYAAHALASSTEDQFVVCNCYAYLKTRVPGLPKMVQIVPNGTPKIGAVAIFAYKDKRTGKMVKHVALIEKMTAMGFSVAETNYTKCLFDRRSVEWDDSHLVGFFSVQ